MEGSSASSTQCQRSAALNPWVLHFHKLGLELKCPLCLNFFDQPVLLPCDHIVCKSCLPDPDHFPIPCPLCQELCSLCGLRPAAFVESIVTIYQRMATTFHSSRSWKPPSGVTKVVDGCLIANNGGIAKGSATIAQNGHKEGKQLACCGGPPVSGDFRNSRSNLRSEHMPDKRTADIDMNQHENSSLGSPPSGSQGLDDDISDQVSGETPVKECVRRLSGPALKNRSRNGRDDNSVLNTEGCLRDAKRQKKLDSSSYELKADAGINEYDGSKTGLEVESQSSPLLSAVDAKKTSNNSFVCAFCSSSATTEAYGEMMHFVDGNPVESDRATGQNVVHVHRKCIEWAPQAYFVGDTVRNLEKELARGAKLKCGRCGLKGAALGCYVKSCHMTYHAPCAIEISACRWDCNNFLMLCPCHVSMKFPNEKSKQRRSKPMPSQSQKTSDSGFSGFWEDSHNKAKTWFLCGSSLSSQDRPLLERFAAMTGASVSKYWSPEVTHVVAAIDEDGACTRTFKVLMAILHGRWVLNINWIRACMEAMAPVDEESYEVLLDNHGSSNGPRLGRLRTLNNNPKLFNGLKFYLAGDFGPAFTRDLRNLVTAGGGEVLKSKESLKGVSGNTEVSAGLIVFNPEPPEGVQLGEEVSIYWQKINEAEELAASSGSKVISYMWILESIASCELQPLVDISNHFC